MQTISIILITWHPFWPRIQFPLAKQFTKLNNCRARKVNSLFE
jgi:hypothetical protein